MLGLDMGLDITYHFYDINFACYYGSYEAYEEFLNFGAFLEDPSDFIYNLVLNFGLMYDAIKDIITFFFYPDYTKADDTYELGYQIGQFFYLLLNPDSIT
jgi:hypothetical protein